MPIRRLIAALVVVATGVVVGVTSLAWACTAQPRIMGLSQISGPAGSPVTIRGSRVATSPGMVEIRWNSVKGPRLASAAADGWGNFSVQFVVPDTAPDVYSLLVVDPSGAVGRASFEVTAPATPGVELPRASAGARQPWASGGRTASGPNTGLTAGVALLGLGLTALLSAFAVTTVRGRRRPAGSAGRR